MIIIKQLLKLEIKRAFFNKKTYISLSISLLIIILQIISIVSHGMLSYEEYSSMGIVPPSVFNSWIEFDSFSIFEEIFFMIFPLLVSFPYGDSLFTDISSGYIKNIITKGKKKEYWISKCIAIFLSGAFVIILPLIISLLLTMSFVPSIPPDLYSHYFSVTKNQMFLELFLTKPYIYTFIYVFIQFIFGGLLACLCIPFTYLVSNKHIVLLCPFALNILIMSLTMNSMVTPTQLIKPTEATEYTLIYIIAEILFFIIILLTTYILKGRPKDVI